MTNNVKEPNEAQETVTLITQIQSAGEHTQKKQNKKTPQIYLHNSQQTAVQQTYSC